MKREHVSPEGFRGIPASKETVGQLIEEGKSPFDLLDSPETKEALTDWFSENHATIAPEQRTQLLEQFIAEDLIDDEVAQQVVIGLPKEERAKVAEYIGSVIAGSKYRRTFWRSYPSIDFGFGGIAPARARNRKRDLKKGMYEKFRERAGEDREFALLMAPFMDLPVTKDTMSEVETMDVLMEAQVLIATEAREAPDAYSAANQDSALFSNADVWALNERIKKRVASLHEKPFLLLPYIPDLIKKGIMDSEKLDEEDVKNTLGIGRYFSYGEFNTKEEQQERDAIYASLKELGIIEHEHETYSPGYAQRRKMWMQLSAIDDIARERMTRHVLGTFNELKPLLDDPDEFLRDKAVYSDVSVPLVAEELGMSNADIVRYVSSLDRDEVTVFSLENLSDYVALLRLGRQREGEKPDLEAFVIAEFKHELRYGNESTKGKWLMLNAETVFPEFSDEVRAEFIGVINEIAPALWMMNPRFAIEEQVMPIQDLLEVAVESWDFQKLYPSLFYEMKRAQALGADLGVSQEDLNRAMRRHFEDKPAKIFDTENKELVEQLFEANELHERILRELQVPVEEYVFSALIKSEYADRYTEQIKTALREDKLLFGELSENFGEFERLLGVVSVDEYLELVEVHASKVEFNTLFDDRLFLEMISRSETRYRRFFRAGFEAGKHGELAKGYRLFNRTIENQEEANSNSDQVEQRLQREIRSLQGELSASNREQDPQRKEEGQEKIRKKIEAKKHELRRLRKRDTLSFQGLKEIKTMRKEFLVELENECEQNAGLVFDKEVMGLLPKNVRDKFIRRDIYSAARISPEVLIGDSAKMIIEAIGKLEYRRLTSLYQRTFCFAVEDGDDWKKKFDNLGYHERRALIHGMYKLNRRLEIEESRILRTDYYDAVIDAYGSDFVFIDFFEDDLRAIAEREQARNGEQKEPDEIEKPVKWIELTDRLAILETSSFARANASELRSAPPEKKEKIISLLEYLAVFELDQWMDFSLVATKEDEFIDKLSKLVEGHLKTVFELPSEAEIEIKYLDRESIGALRYYLLHKARSEKGMHEQVQELAVKLFGGVYETWRQWGTDTVSEEEKPERLEQFKKDGVLPKGLTLEQYERWNETTEQGVEEVFESGVKHVRTAIKDLLSQSVADHHVSESDVAVGSVELFGQRRALTAELEPLVSERQAINRMFAEARIAKKKGLPFEEPSAEVQNRYAELKTQIAQYRAQRDREFLRVDTLSYLQRLRKLSSEELEGKYLRIGKQNVSFKKAFRILRRMHAGNELFLRDLKNIEDQLEKANKDIFGGGGVSREKLTISDQIDGKTYLMIGEKPVPSCQSYRSHEGYNGGLIGSMRDPNIKYIQIHNESGAIITRAALRLLGDEQGNPALFIERVYSTNQHPKIKEMVVNFAREKAQALGMELYSNEVADGAVKTESKTLYSHGSRGAYVYTDAGGGLKPEGQYQIHARKLAAA